MPPKKKTVKNAYYFFMEEYMNDRNRKNPRNPITIKDAASLCSPLWQAMTPQDKKKYEDIAKKEKVRAKGMDKLTTTGLVVSEVERREKEHEEYCRQMKEYVKNMVEELNLTGLLEKKFYFIHVNHFCQCEDGSYIPAEVGVSCFSLKYGVNDYYHSMIAPGNVPIGYTYKAQKYSEETHGIPLPPSEIGENDFSKLYVDIRHFVKDGCVDDISMVFTVKEYEPCVTDFLRKICFAAGYDEKQFRVHDLIDLFFEVKNRVASLLEVEGFPVYSLAQREIENDYFAYTKEICCYWHEGSEAPQYCSLSRAKRWGFHIADYCTRGLDIVLIPGQHLPSTHEYWNDKPFEGAQMSRSRRKKAGGKSEASGSACSTTSEPPALQPLRQPRSLGIAVSQMLPRGDGPSQVDDKEFPPLGRRMGANFSRLT